MSPTKSLEERFLNFVRTIGGSEFIDELELSDAQRKSKKADFFFSDRTVICELKSLKTDTEPKIEALLDPYRNTEDWPEFYGNWDISKILKHLPKSEEINRKLINAVSSSAHGAIRSANQQIRSTKKLFSIPKAGGVLVLLNDSVQVLGPDLLLRRAIEVLRKRKPNGDLQFPEIDVTWILTETHSMELRDDRVGLPAGIIADWDSDEVKPVADLVERLQPLWAEFNGIPFISTEMNWKQPPAFNPLTRQNPLHPPHLEGDELAKLMYRKQPYLRKLRRRELLKRGRQLLKVITKEQGGTTPSRRNQLADALTHFIEEINHQGIDMREVGDFDLSNIKPRKAEPRSKKRAPAQPEVQEAQKAQSPEAGRFYTQEPLGFNYYCETIKNGKVTWYLVESYQHGALFQGRYVQDAGFSNLYTKITDPDEVERLTEIYRHASKKKKSARKG